MNAKRAAVLGAALTVCGLGASGCDQSSGGAAPPATTSAAPSAPPPVASASAAPSAAPSSSAAAISPDDHRHVGLAGVLLRAAYDQNLTDAERAPLDKAEAQLYPTGGTSPWTAAQAFHTDLVAGIRAHKLDAAKLTADYAAFDKAAAAGQAGEADALNTLHGAMSPADRQTLVSKVRGQLAAREHAWPVPAASDAGTPEWITHKVERWASDMSLDDGQKKAITALLAKDATMTPAAMQARHDAVQKQVDTLLTDFAKDPFDAKKEALAPPAGKTPHDGLEKQATLATAMLGILKGDQIDKYADRLDRTRERLGYVPNYDQGAPSPWGGQDDRGPGNGGGGGLR